eukprot:1180269-Prorocentrum_minimum.AAC.4
MAITRLRLLQTSDVTPERTLATVFTRVAHPSRIPMDMFEAPSSVRMNTGSSENTIIVDELQKNPTKPIAPTKRQSEW